MERGEGGGTEEAGRVVCVDDHHHFTYVDGILVVGKLRWPR